jgi:Domain of Unknown Function with PDB structure (DUF3857)/Transglutaminase-like superfamily
MSNRSSSYGPRPPLQSDRPRGWPWGYLGSLALLSLLTALPANAADAPDWLHALTSVALPAHEETTSAVLLYSEDVATVRPDGRLRTRTRKAYRILRPDGQRFADVALTFDSQSPITAIHGWCIPPGGKDLVVKDKDTAETAMPGIANGYLISDLRAKVMHIPGAVPGSTIGYEAEQDSPPYLLNDEWDPQDTIPVREARYTLELPVGWTHTATWLNHSAVAPTDSVQGAIHRWQWGLSDLPAVSIEEHMPPWKGIAAHMVVSVAQSNAQSSGWTNWRDLGNWHLKLVGNRGDPSPEIRDKVTTLTSSATTQLARVQAVARFVQTDIRYVAIELGIGGYQPHAAAEVFAHRYGDCKDKVTLLSSMLRVMGVDSFPVVINTVRGTVSADTPANLYFNHLILAIRLPAGTEDAHLLATAVHPKVGQLLFFDPTDTLTPLGQLSGALQSNYGLLVSPDASELIRLPQLPADTSGIRRTASMVLDEKGTLSGEITEVRVGDAASYERGKLNSMPLDADRIKPVEARVASSLSTFRITKAAVGNVDALEMPFVWHYTLEARNYARATGNLLLVRPRIVGSMAHGFLETKETRRHAIEFEGPARDTDVFDIELPPNCKVEELPPPMEADLGFVSYSSKTELVGGKLRYSRSFQIKQLSVPADKAIELRDLYRRIADDERRTAVLSIGQS